MMNDATRAYAATSARRSMRDQEAEVFSRTSIGLRIGREQGGLAQARAIADNQRLWRMVIDMLHDDNNALPLQLRAMIISVGLCVQREMQLPKPDFAFLAAVNENVAAGLAGNV